MLGLNTHPKWKVVRGGSHTYIPQLTAALADRVVHSAAIQGISRGERGVAVGFFDRAPMMFDEVVFACHGDQVLPLLTDATDRERDVFARFKTTTNVTWLHTDDGLLPSRADAKASWNYLLASVLRSHLWRSLTCVANSMQAIPVLSVAVCMRNSCMFWNSDSRLSSSLTVVARPVACSVETAAM